MDYEERLAEIEAEWVEFEKAHVDLKARMAQVLRDRPSDFVIVSGDKVWLQYRTIRGELGGYGFSKLPADHPRAHRFKTRLQAERHKEYLERLHHSKYDVKEIPKA